MDVTCKRRRGVKDDSKVFDLSDLKNKLLSAKIENERSRDGGEVEYWEISLRCITFDMSVRQHVTVEQVVWILCLEFRVEVQG